MTVTQCLGSVPCSAAPHFVCNAAESDSVKVVPLRYERVLVVLFLLSACGESSVTIMIWRRWFLCKLLSLSLCVRARTPAVCEVLSVNPCFIVQTIPLRCATWAMNV